MLVNKVWQNITIRQIRQTLSLQSFVVYGNHYSSYIGYAFVVYSKPSGAWECIKTLNNYEIRKGRYLGVCTSIDNCRLFVGGIPTLSQKDEVIAEISKVTEGVVDVIMYLSASKNRGFAFITYLSHRAAVMARRKLISGGIKLCGHKIFVDWAEPGIEPDEEIMSQVC